MLDDDYDIDDFEIDDDAPKPSQKKNTTLSNQYNFGSSNKPTSQIRPVGISNNNANKSDDDSYGDDDFEEVGAKSKVTPSYNVTSNTKPLGLNNKPDWLNNNKKPDWMKSNNSATKPGGITANKPNVLSGNASSINSYGSTKPFSNNFGSRKAEAISENRNHNSKLNLNKNNDNRSSGVNITRVNNPSSKNSTSNAPSKASRNKNKRDFSQDLNLSKPKKINLPKDYLDKYTKNNPVRDLERSLKSIKDNIKKLQADLADSHNISNDYKRQKALQRINKELRNELKKLSESSTVLCDELQKKHYKSKKKTPRKLDGETELKIKDREIENADKQMANLLNEYNHVKKRIEQVGDYNYVVELKAKVNQNEQKIKENEKLIKEMEQNQKRRDIQMNRLVKEEKTEKMRRVDFKQSKLTYLQEKINDLEAKVEVLKQVRQEQDDQETETKQKYAAMLKIGEHYGITEKNVDNEDQIFRNKLLEKYQQVARKEKHVETEIDNIEKQYKIEIKEKKKSVKEYNDKKRKFGQEIIQTIQDIRAKAHQLDGLIDKMKGFEMGEEILNKWSDENRRLLEKLDKDEQTALDTDDIDIQPKPPSPPPNKRVNNSYVNKTPVPEKKVNKPPEPKVKPSITGNNKPSIGSNNKPSIGGGNNKPSIGGGSNRPNLNASKQSIEEDIPYTFEHKKQEEQPKPAATKPFGGIGTKSKPAFGKPFNKPFGIKPNTDNSANQSRVSERQESVKADEPKNQPLSFTEKYGLSNNNQNSKPSITPAQNTNTQPAAPQSNIASKAPWLKNNNNAGSNANQNNNDYIPTVGGGASSISRRRAQEPQNDYNAIPTLNDDNKSTLSDRRRADPFAKNNESNFSQRFNLGGGNTDNKPTFSQRSNVQNFGQPKNDFSRPNAIPTIGKDDDNNFNIPTIGEKKANNDFTNRIPTIGGNENNDNFNIPTLNDKPANNDFTNRIPTIGGNDDNQIDSIPTIGESRRRVGADNSNNGGGYMPSGFDKPKQDDNAGGRRRVADPFSKFDNQDPITSLASKKNDVFSNNVSNISGGGMSGKNDLFSNASNKNNQPSFFDKLKDSGNKDNEPKKNDFWSDILGNDDKPKPVKKIPESKPIATTVAPTNNRVNKFDDVADLEEEFMLD